MEFEKHQRDDALTAQLRDIEARRAGQLRSRFRLVKATPCEETIAHLRTLLDEAEAGQLIGIGWVGIYRGREWDSHCCGEARRNMARTIGMLYAYCARLAAFMNR